MNNQQENDNKITVGNEMIPTSVYINNIKDNKKKNKRFNKKNTEKTNIKHSDKKALGIIMIVLIIINITLYVLSFRNGNSKICTSDDFRGQAYLLLIPTLMSIISYVNVKSLPVVLGLLAFLIFNLNAVIFASILTSLAHSSESLCFYPKCLIVLSIFLIIIALIASDSNREEEKQEDEEDNNN